MREIDTRISMRLSSPPNWVQFPHRVCMARSDSSVRSQTSEVLETSEV